MQEGLPYRVIGQKGFLEAGSVRAALAFCRYVQQPQDGLCLLHALELEAFHPGKAILARLRGHLGQDGLPDPLQILPAAGARKLQALKAAGEVYGRLAGTHRPRPFSCGTGSRSTGPKKTRNWST